MHSMLMLTVSSRVSVGAFSMSFIAVKTMYIIHQTRPNASYVLVGIVYCYFGGLWPAAGVPVRIDAEIGVSWAQLATNGMCPCPFP